MWFRNTSTLADPNPNPKPNLNHNSLVVVSAW